MAGYEDTRQKIISTLMGRPNGTEIQPENHQDYALNMLDYIRSLELIATSTLIGVAESNSTPVQPNASRVCYIAGVAQNQTVVFENFIDENGNPISVTTGDMEGVFIILLWNTQYWSAQTFSTNIISHSESATFYYRYNIRKTYASIALMNDDVASPIGTDGKYIKVGDIVTVVNSTTPSENGIYSYEGTTDGWKFQSSFNFQVEQIRSQNENTSPSSKLFDDEFASVRSDLSGTPVYNSTLTFIGEVNKTLYNIVNEGFFTISLSSDTGINIDLYYKKTDGNLSLLKNISDYKNKLIYIPSDFQGNLLFHNNDNSTVTVTVVLRKSGQIDRIENLENDIEIDKIDTFGEKLYSNNLTFSSGVVNRNIGGAVYPNLICYLKIQSTYQLDISVNIQTTLGYQEIMHINENGIYRLTIPNESINNLLILTSTSSENINATIDIIKDGFSNQLDYVDSIISYLDGSYIFYSKLTYTGIQNKTISLFEKDNIYQISIRPLIEESISVMYLSTDSTYKEIIAISDSDDYSFRFPDDAANNSILLFHAKNTNITLSVSIKKNTYKSLSSYIRHQKISNFDLLDIKNRLYNIENLPNYNNIVIVSANGTIGTDCDYNDIKSALDYAADGSKSNRYLIFVKNGDYDISNMTDAYLGLRNYVDIIGESITNVRVINRRSEYDILACCFDTHKYAIRGGIEDAMLANMTLISYNCKSPFHSDYGGNDIKYGGVVTLKNIRLVNENDNTSDTYRDGIACGIIYGRKIKCINCFGNVYIWIHNWENNDHYKEGAVVELTNCNVLNIGCKDLGSMANDRLIIDGCTANLVFVGNMNNAVSNSRCSWSLDFKGNNNIGYVLPEPNQNWYSQFPFCVNGIHRSAINTSNIRINKGDLVSMSYINSGVVESSNDAIHELGVVPYNWNYLYGISLDDIEPGGEGIIQYSGVIKQSTLLSLQLGDYVKAFENSFILSTKSEADGIVVAIDGIGTWIKLFNRI